MTPVEIILAAFVAALLIRCYRLRKTLNLAIAMLNRHTDALQKHKASIEGLQVNQQGLVANQESLSEHVRTLAGGLSRTSELFAQIQGGKP